MEQRLKNMSKKRREHLQMVRDLRNQGLNGRQIKSVLADKRKQVKKNRARRELRSRAMTQLEVLRKRLKKKARKHLQEEFKVGTWNTRLLGATHGRTDPAMKIATTAVKTT